MASSTKSKDRLSVDIATDEDPEKSSPQATTAQDEASTDDPNDVYWDGPDDTANPLNWSSAKKLLNIFILSAMTFLTPLASSMFAPSVPEVMREFHSDRYKTLGARCLFPH